jgi:mRNA interferase MazF
MPEQGDIVLIPVPFTDLSAQKRRPVIIVSNDAYHQATSDMVVVAMTSNPAGSAAAYRFTITDAYLERGKLNRPGTVRADKIYTLAQSLIVSTFGRVNPDVLNRIRQMIDDLTALHPDAE